MGYFLLEHVLKMQKSNKNFYEKCYLCRHRTLKCPQVHNARAVVTIGASNGDVNSISCPTWSRNRPATVPTPTLPTIRYRQKRETEHQEKQRCILMYNVIVAERSATFRYASSYRKICYIVIFCIQC